MGREEEGSNGRGLGGGRGRESLATMHQYQNINASYIVPMRHASCLAFSPTNAAIASNIKTQERRNTETQGAPPSSSQRRSKRRHRSEHRNRDAGGSARSARRRRSKSNVVKGGREGEREISRKRKGQGQGEREKRRNGENGRWGHNATA